MKYNTFYTIKLIFKIIIGAFILGIIYYQFYQEIKINKKKQVYKKLKVDTLKRIEKMNRRRNGNIRKNNI